jgi:hypothetical protein
LSGIKKRPCARPRRSGEVLRPQLERLAVRRTRGGDLARQRIGPFGPFLRAEQTAAQRKAAPLAIRLGLAP